MHYKNSPEVAVVYFYFDFNDAEKQKHGNLLRSLIVQLSMQSLNIPESLEVLFLRSQDGQQQPTIGALTSTLKHILENFQQTFIILDALDECKEREELLGLVESIVDWKLEGLHILATSRVVREIEVSLEPLVTAQICIQSAIINADIHIHIRERLQNDIKLRKWSTNIQTEIESVLMNGADGMYVIIKSLNYFYEVLIVFLKVPMGCVPIRCSEEMPEARCSPQSIEVIAEDIRRYLRFNTMRYR